MSTTSEYPQPLEIETDVHDSVGEMTFTRNGEYLVTGNWRNVQVWRVKDGKQIATMPISEDGTPVRCVAASDDGRWVAAGSFDNELWVWDTATCTRVMVDWMENMINDLDFSPASRKFVSADDESNTATIWDIAARRQVRTLDHKPDQELDETCVFTAKYSPRGDRIATAFSSESVRIWDSTDGRLLVYVKVPIGGLFWCKNHLFVTTASRKIRKIDPATGSIVPEWSRPVPSDADSYSGIAMPQHERFIACSLRKTVTFWDTSTLTQFSPIHNTDKISSIACSSDGRCVAIADKRKIVVKPIPSVSLPLIPEPEIDIESAALCAWDAGELTDAEASLSAANIPTSENRHHVLASRALIRARLGDWDAALVDAKESTSIQQSIIGYIAHCVTLIGKGEKDKGFQVFDAAFLRFPSEHISLFLLIKAVVLFMTEEHVIAISRMDDLIIDAWTDPAMYVVQGYMLLVSGNNHMESGDYERAIQLFEDARTRLCNPTRQPPLIVSLISGWNFDDLDIKVQQRLCEALLAAGRVKEAGESARRIVYGISNSFDPIEGWVYDFKHRCSSKLEGYGDCALDAKQYDEAASQYTTALSFELSRQEDLLVKRSKAYAQNGKWEDALKDANEVINLVSFSSSGYERKYAALLGMGRLDDATDAFETMLLKMSDSFDPDIRERSRCYVRPERIKKAIRTSIKNATLNSPLVLINALSGRLCNKSEQAAAFESMPIFTTLITSMTTHIDHALIEQEVGEFYRYVTLSHTWEGDEPLYEKVVKTVVYDLEALPTHEKLRMFCKIVRDEGFIWAWSDTCCIDKGDHFVLQEALVSMFKWYEWSALTIIFLCDVDKLAELGALMRSLWNSRGWTLQEYHASRVVRIYTKDWTPYLGLTIYNHKESPEIVSEMEQATGISAQALMALRPGLNDVREKLRLASTRQTTRVEDAAYSLLGIFSVTLPVTYGEGDKALGRLLSQLLMTSGDTSILAWTGRPGSFNSCLPTDIIVFSQPPTSHIPTAIPEAEMGMITAELHGPSLDLTLATRLYDRLAELRTPTFAGQRMRLPCLVFKITTILPFRKGPEIVFRAQAGALGVVEINNSQNLTILDSLYLIHPWVDFLLDRRAARNVVRRTHVKDGPSQPEESLSLDSLPDISEHRALDVTLLPSPSTASSMDTQMRVYKFLTRLRQPFSALLLASNPWNVTEYRRIVPESLIRVQVKEITPATLEWMIQGVQVLDVL